MKRGLLLALLAAVLALKLMPALVAVSAALLLTEGLTWWRSARQVACVQATTLTCQPTHNKTDIR